MLFVCVPHAMERCSTYHHHHDDGFGLSAADRRIKKPARNLHVSRWENWLDWRARMPVSRELFGLATVWKTPVMWVQTHQNQKQKQAVGQRSVVFLWPFVWKKTHFTHIKVSTQTYCSCCSLLLLRRTLKTKKDGEITCAASERIQSATDAIGP